MSSVPTPSLRAAQHPGLVARPRIPLCAVLSHSNTWYEHEQEEELCRQPSLIPGFVLSGPWASSYLFVATPSFFVFCKPLTGEAAFKSSLLITLKFTLLCPNVKHTQILPFGRNLPHLAVGMAKGSRQWKCLKAAVFGAGVLGTEVWRTWAAGLCSSIQTSQHLFQAQITLLFMGGHCREEKYSLIYPTQTI